MGIPRITGTALLFSALSLAAAIGCGSTRDLVLDDPVFVEDMVNAALAGVKFRITPEDYPGIRRLLADDRADYRRAGLIIAAHIDDQILDPEVIAAAADQDAAVSEEALKIIRDRADSFRPVLLEMLNSAAPSRRSAALVLLGTVGSEDLVPVFIRFFSDPDEDVRNRASIAVRTATDRQDPFLQDALENPVPITAAMAYRTLGRYEHPDDALRFIEAFTHPYAEVRREAQLAALRLGDSGLPYLHIEASDAQRPYESRLAALNVIQGTRSGESPPTLIGLLNDPDDRIRSKASIILGTYGSETIPVLVKLYRESGEAERIHAVRLMGEIQSADALPTLAEAFADPHPPVRAAAREAVLSFGPRAHPVLRSLIEGGPPPAASLALELLRAGEDDWLIYREDGSVNQRALFLLITESEEADIRAYLLAAEVPRLKQESILSLRDAWTIAEEFSILEKDIGTGLDPYLYVWRQREMYSAAARESLERSFEAAHSFFYTEDPEDLKRAGTIRSESRRYEEEARKSRDLIAEMSPETRARGEERLQRYREMRDSLVRTWEYVDPELRELAEMLFAGRNLDPRTLSRESVLLE